MAKNPSGKKFHNEEISFNPFQELLATKTQHSKPVKEKEKSDSSDIQNPPNKCIDLLDDLFPAIQKIVLRIERKGRRGKTVTLLDISPVPSPDAFACLLKSLKKTLGCGASIADNSRIVFQGDQRERLEKWFTGQGSSRVIRG